jgi:dipeptidase E
VNIRGTTKRLLLISSSTLHGSGYLDHAESEIRDFLGGTACVVFIPFAMYDRKAYTTKTRERFRAMGYDLTSVHDVSNAQRLVDRANAIFVGGGNTFRLLKGLYDADLLEVIQERVNRAVPYIGSSAGSIVACPSLRTTKDMPVVQPPSFEALGLVGFQISPHYLDPDPSSTHMGEMQEERIRQFLEENGEAVVGLREGSMLRVEKGTVTLKGSTAARVFRAGEEPVEVLPTTKLDDLLRQPSCCAEPNP